ncbi:DNA alkylation repair protein [Engelhardtia mirabilis]|uniref:DNA alkylation repair enzyme n=1 Tax=Engelhardtia mirabilis TaxID=2528011 RepID=A0A518BE00_9BACT|nr:hypothetical protein Pla133_02830 [Planctomycetes bacterium Pla133]QDU99545.1 hypothetical protein Pla86_02830 [Planctomycetes bacterium Pla86]
MATRRSAGAGSAGADGLAQALAWLERQGTKAEIAKLERYGIDAHRPFGVAVGELKRYAKSVGRDHDLALGLWASDRYEAGSWPRWWASPRAWPLPTTPPRAGSGGTRRASSAVLRCARD